MRDLLTHRLIERGLLCRTDDRRDPVIRLSPPLIAGPAEFDEITRILDEVLTEGETELRPRSTRREKRR